MTTLELLRTDRVLSVVRTPALDDARDLCGALVAGGIHVIELTFTTLDEAKAPAVERSSELDALSRALDVLAELEPALVELVDLKFFCGFSFAEIAALRSVSERTVQRDWAKARLLLRRALEE